MLVLARTRSGSVFEKVSTTNVHTLIDLCVFALDGEQTLPKNGGTDKAFLEEG